MGIRLVSPWNDLGGEKGKGKQRTRSLSEGVPFRESFRTVLAVSVESDMR
ncbi:MAG: hypothetical protein RLZZ74_1897, partial [Cyanobacteriota bacterium]